jgi:hypothetical protein
VDTADVEPRALRQLNVRWLLLLIAVVRVLETLLLAVRERRVPTTSAQGAAPAE